MKITEIDENTIVIDHHSHKMVDAIEFFEELFRLAGEGYEFVKPKLPRECPVAPSISCLKLRKPAVDPLEGITKKVDLLAFAKENKIEVPEDKQARPASIRKFIKDTLNGKEIKE